MNLFSKHTVIRFVGALIAVVFASPPSSGADRMAVGSVKDLRGSANLLRSSEKVEAKKNEQVLLTDRVRTFEKSRVKIILVDDSILMIGENSNVSIAENFGKGKKTSVFNLLDGAINVIVGKTAVEVHTPTAVAAARGTSYVVWVEGDKTGVAVAEGQVDFGGLDDRSEKRTTVSAGRMSVFEVGKPPAVSTKTYRDTLKRYYEDTLEPDERWGPVILKATGSGIRPPHIGNPAQSRLMAVRAAKVDAFRNLLEQAQGVSIISETKIEDFITRNDQIRARVDAFIKGAWISEERELADGTIEVDMEIGLGIGFRRMFIEMTE